MEPNFEVAASWYDGHSAVRHEGVARWDRLDRLSLRSAHSALDIPLDDLRFGESHSDRVIYRRASEPDFRLTLPTDMPPGFARHLPAKSTYGGWIDRLGLGKAATADIQHPQHQQRRQQIAHLTPPTG